MGEQRVRVMVGEGQTTRKGLLRFVLENEGYDVVAEATSTLELAQRLVIHRPDVVVVDDGIDASAVGMMREVLPSAKVVLVWPRGVTAVGADARLEPSEVMTSLGSTVGRLMGRGPVIAPPRPRFSPPDVIVVPEPEPEDDAAPDVAAPAAPGIPGTLEAPPIERGGGGHGRRGSRRRARSRAAVTIDRRSRAPVERADATGRHRGARLDLHRARRKDDPAWRSARADGGDRPRGRGRPARDRLGGDARQHRLGPHADRGRQRRGLPVAGHGAETSPPISREHTRASSTSAPMAPSTCGHPGTSNCASTVSRISSRSAT